MRFHAMFLNFLQKTEILLPDVRVMKNAVVTFALASSAYQTGYLLIVSYISKTMALKSSLDLYLRLRHVD